MKYTYEKNEQGDYRVSVVEKQEAQKMYRSRFDWLPLPVSLAFLKDLREVHCSDRFLSQYVRAHGKPRYVSEEWKKKREQALIQLSAKLRVLWEDGKPTVEHLAAISWAFSPVGEKGLRNGGNSHVGE